MQSFSLNFAIKYIWIICPNIFKQGKFNSVMSVSIIYNWQDRARFSITDPHMGLILQGNCKLWLDWFEI